MLCLSWFGVFIEEEQHGRSHGGREIENGNNLCIEGSWQTWQYAAVLPPAPAHGERQSRIRQRNLKDKQQIRDGMRLSSTPSFKEVVMF